MADASYPAAPCAVERNLRAGSGAVAQPPAAPGKRFTRKEDATIGRLVKQGRSYRFIGGKLGRDPEEVRTRAWALRGRGTPGRNPRREGVGQDWTLDQDMLACHWRREGLSFEEIGARLTPPRSGPAVGHQLARLRESGVDVPAKGHEKAATPHRERFLSPPWTREQHEQLLALIAQGQSLVDVAEQLGRTHGACKLRLQGHRAGRLFRYPPAEARRIHNGGGYGRTGDFKPKPMSPERAGASPTETVKVASMPQPEHSPFIMLVPKGESPEAPARPSEAAEPQRTTRPNFATYAKAPPRGPVAFAGFSFSSPRLALKSDRAELAAWLDNVGTPAPWTVQMDLAMLEGLFTHGDRAGTAHRLKVTSEAMIARFRQITRPTKSDPNAACNLDGIRVLTEVLRERLALSGEVAA